MGLADQFGPERVFNTPLYARKSVRTEVCVDELTVIIEIYPGRNKASRVSVSASPLWDIRLWQRCSRLRFPDIFHICIR